MVNYCKQFIDAGGMSENAEIKTTKYMPMTLRIEIVRKQVRKSTVNICQPVIHAKNQKKIMIAKYAEEN